FHCLPGCAPRQRINASGVIQWNSTPIGNIPRCRKEGRILVIYPSPRSGKIRAVHHRSKRSPDSKTRRGRLSQKNRGAYKQSKECNTERDRSHGSSYRAAHGAGFQPAASACFLKCAAVIIG